VRAPPLRLLEGHGVGGGRPGGARSRDFGLDGPVDDWKRLREEIVDEVCSRGFDTRRGAFTQYYGSRELDAALLRLPSVGFLAGTDERVVGTVAAIERGLCRGGLVQRYSTSGRSEQLDGLPSGEGAFLPCSFWLADAYLLGGTPRRGARAVRAVAGAAQRRRPALRGVRPGRATAGRELPQGLSHLGLVDTALDLASDTGPSHRRGAR
jgi:GH15 family glucan-1,4-alpha-glucosidase